MRDSLLDQENALGAHAMTGLSRRQSAAFQGCAEFAISVTGRTSYEEEWREDPLFRETPPLRTDNVLLPQPKTQEGHEMFFSVNELVYGHPALSLWLVGCHWHGLVFRNREGTRLAFLEQRPCWFRS